jgi:hypothetical protein
MLIKTLVLFVFESPMSLRHSCQPFAGHQVAEECRRLIGDSKTKKTTGFTSISLLILENNQENHRFYKHFLTKRIE